MPQHISFSTMPAGGEARRRWFAENLGKRGFTYGPGWLDVEAGVPLQHSDPTVKPWHYPVKPLPQKRPSGWFPFLLVLFVIALTAATVGVMAR